MKKTKKRWLISIASIVVLSLVIGLSLNFILSNISQRIVKSNLLTYNQTNDFKISIAKVKINVFSSTLIIKDLQLGYDSSLKNDFINHNYPASAISKYKFDDIRIRGYNIFKILLYRDINIKLIEVKGLVAEILQSNKNKVTNTNKDKLDKQINFIQPDSLVISYLDKLELGKIQIAHFSMRILNSDKGDTTFRYSGEQLELSGLKLDNKKGLKGVFEINTNDLRLKLRQQKIDLPSMSSFLYFAKLDYKFSDKTLIISDFKLKPNTNPWKVASAQKFAKEVNDLECAKIEFINFQLRKFLKEGIIFIRKINLNEFKIAFYKDKNRPFDLNKRPLFPQQLLKKLEQKIYVDTIELKNSNMVYNELQAKSQKPMVVELNNINAKILKVSSIKDSLKRSKLEIDLKAKLMNQASLSLFVLMPYKSPVDTFYFSGYLGGSNLKAYNKALYPATGIKISNGKLKSLKFDANASPKGAKGKLVMLYTDLEAEVTKSDLEKKDNTLSWIANAVLVSNNPKKNGRIKTALIDVDRIEYKGFGNLLWKSVQSGLMNTILPVGKKHKSKIKR